MSHHDLPLRPQSSRTGARVVRLTIGLIIGAVVATAGYVALGDPGKASRATWLDDAGPGSAALGLLSPELTGPVAHSSSPPTRLTIPAIRVDTTLEALSLKADGTLPAPTSDQHAGWYADGVRPGSVGPAIIVVQVHSTPAPGVFFRLRLLHIGDEIRVRRLDGSTVRFLVDDVHAYPKDAFPQQVVYGPTTEPVVRLITYNGTFEQPSANYLDNLVVSAHLV